MKYVPLVLLIAVMACSGMKERDTVDVRCRFDPASDSIKNVEKGFCGPDSYRVTATGVPAKIGTDQKKRRKSAVYAAILLAHYFMRMAFEGHCIEQSMRGFPKSYAERRKAWQKEIRELVKNGKAVYSTCDGSDNCTILYELRVKGLRKKIDACYR